MNSLIFFEVWKLKSIILIKLTKKLEPTQSNESKTNLMTNPLNVILFVLSTVTANLWTIYCFIRFSSFRIFFYETISGLFVANFS